MRVPAGARSGRCNLASVFGKELLAPSTIPLPRPSFPSNAGSATIARIAPPPCRPRSSPFPGATTSGSASAIHSASVRIWSSGTPQTEAARDTGHSRARAMNSSKPSTLAAMNSLSSLPARSSSAATAHAKGVSVPGRVCRCRSACSAILVRSGSMTASRPPRRFAFRMPRTRCTFDTVALLPQTRLSLAPSAKSGGQPGTAP